ncbi:MAG: J domain-containing protein [Planctomycetota bacterium]|nr:J domain-containing protein [Planctomycetota bacterium]
MARLPMRNLPPEAEELERKQRELAQLEIELAERELELTTLRAALAALERRYLEVVGGRYAQLDRIEAEIAEELARRRPTDASAEATARAAREKANESADPVGNEGVDSSAATHILSDFQPSDELRRLYRQAARTLHPDLATDPAEQDRRRRFMTELNKAYGEGDEDRIRQLLREWHACPENVQGEGTAAELVRAIRKIAQVRHRLEAIARELHEASESELSQLKTRVDEAALESRDLLQEMARRVDAEVAMAQRRWNQIVRDKSVWKKTVWTSLSVSYQLVPT